MQEEAKIDSKNHSSSFSDSDFLRKWSKIDAKKKKNWCKKCKKMIQKMKQK